MQAAFTVLDGGSSEAAVMRLPGSRCRGEGVCGSHRLPLQGDAHERQPDGTGSTHHAGP